MASVSAGRIILTFIGGLPDHDHGNLPCRRPGAIDQEHPLGAASCSRPSAIGHATLPPSMDSSSGGDVRARSDHDAGAVVEAPHVDDTPSQGGVGQQGVEAIGEIDQIRGPSVRIPSRVWR